MELATLQRQLLGLVKETYEISENDDPYIQIVARSENLRVVREIVASWRNYNLQSYCVFTSTLLIQRNKFDEAVKSFVNKRKHSPFIEQLGTEFLEELSSRENPLIASVAQFELALIKVKLGDPEEYIIDWEHEPYSVLNSIIQGLSLNEDSVRGSYRVIVSKNLPNFFRVVTRD